jgi:hypothetical protein
MKNYQLPQTIERKHAMKDESEDTKGVIRILASKNRQHNDQEKKYKRKNNYHQNIHIEGKIE